MLTLNKPTWDQDVANPQTGYIITHMPDTTAQNPYQSTKVPVLFFAATALNEIRYITEKRTSEISMFCITKELGDGLPHYLVYDFVIPKQEVTPVLTSIDGESLKEYTELLKPHFPNNGMHKYLTHLHLHPNMGVGWSGTDLTQQNTKGELGFESDYRFYVCLNSNGQLNVTFVQYKPFFHRLENVGQGLYVGDKYAPKTITKDRKAELDAIVLENVKPKVTIVPKREDFDWTHFRDGIDWPRRDILPAEIDTIATGAITPLAVSNLLTTLKDFTSATTPHKDIKEALNKHNFKVQTDAVAKKLTTVFRNFAELQNEQYAATIEVINALEEGYFDDAPMEDLNDYLAIHELFIGEDTIVCSKTI